MKKLLIMGAGVAVIGVAGWAGLWFLGKGEVERRADLEIARLEARGWTVTHEAREVEGFPFGYAVNFVNLAAVEVDSGLLVQLPDLRVSKDPTAPDQLRVNMPASFEVHAPMTEEMRRENELLPKVLKMKAEAEDFVILSTGAQGAGATRDFLATRLRMALDQEDFNGKLALTLTGLDSGTAGKAPDAPSGTGTVVSRLKADQLLVEIEDYGQGEGAKSSTGEFRYDAFTLTASTDLATLEGIREAVYGGAAGKLDGAFQTGAIHASVATGEADDPEGATFIYTGKSSTGIYAMDGGTIDLKSEVRDNTWQLVANNPASPVAGKVGVEQIQALYRMPMAPSERPGDMAVRLELDGLNMDEGTWATLDPKGVLPRDAAYFVVDLEGTVRVTKRIDRMRTGEAPPYELANLIVKDVALSALGASAKVEGDVEMIQPVNAPQGLLNVEFSGAQALMTALGQAGLLPDEMVDMGNAMLQVYARPTGEEDGWRTEVSFANDGISVNGLPVQ